MRRDRHREDPVLRHVAARSRTQSTRRKSRENTKKSVNIFDLPGKRSCVARCAAQRLSGALSRHRPQSAARTSGYDRRFCVNLVNSMAYDMGSWRGTCFGLKLPRGHEPQAACRSDLASRPPSRRSAAVVAPQGRSYQWTKPSLRLWGRQINSLRYGFMERHLYQLHTARRP